MRCEKCKRLEKRIRVLETALKDIRGLATAVAPRETKTKQDVIQEVCARVGSEWKRHLLGRTRPTNQQPQDEE